MKRIKQGQVEASHASGWVEGPGSPQSATTLRPQNGGKGISGCCGGVMREKQIGGGEMEGSSLCAMK